MTYKTSPRPGFRLTRSSLSIWSEFQNSVSYLKTLERYCWGFFLCFFF